MPVDEAAEVIANHQLSADYHVLALAAPAIAASAQPGQFVMVKAGTSHDPLLRRPFSIFEILRDGDGTAAGISLFSKRVGVSTRLMYAARTGQRIRCLGPLGRCWDLPDASATAYMVAGGVGLAAFATLGEELRRQRVAATLFYGARTGAELFYVDFFRRLGIDLVLTTEDGTIGERGRVTVPLQRYLVERRHRSPVVYACGPEAMMEAVTEVTIRHQTACFVSMERVMGCGLGGCYSCVVPLRDDSGQTHHVRSCIAGPVLPGERVRWKSA